jgi:autotransporter-associated beta strand protein
MLCAAAIPATAGTLQWDANAGTTGTSDAPAAWNGVDARWLDGSTNVVWADNSDAQFGTGTTGTAGAVTIGTIDPTVNSITFNAASGGGNFNITGRTINLLNASTDITANSGDHTITSSLAGIGKGINKKGAAQVRLAGAITYTGTTTITAGTLRVNSGANTLYSSTSGFSMAGGSLVISAGSTQNIAKDFTFSSASGDITTFDGLGNTGHALGGTMTINNGAVMAIRPRNANAGATMVNFDVTGKITGAGNFRVAGNGSDAAVAAAKVSNTSNDYSGTTTIGGARLVLGNSGVIPNGSTVTMSLASDKIPSLDLNGNNETIAGLSSTATGAVIFNNSGAGTSTLTVGSGDASSNFAGVIKNDDGTTGGTVALTKIGNGTLTLSGTSTYTGDTLVNNGTLALSSTGGLNFKIGLDGVNNQINGAGTVSLDGLFTFDLTSASTTIDDSWNIVNVATLIESFGSNFSINSFTRNGGGTGAGIWTKVIDLDSRYLFNTSSGVLTVIPEPRAALLGGLGMLALLRRRRA